MSASATQFKTREMIELISETKLGEFGIFMNQAVKAGYDAIDVQQGVESNFAATIMIFMDSLPENKREQVCREFCFGVLSWTLANLWRLQESEQGAPSSAAAE